MKLTAAQIRGACVLLEILTALMVGINLGFIVSVIWTAAAR